MLTLTDLLFQIKLADIVIYSLKLFMIGLK